jgi:hypothetical protein
MECAKGRIRPKPCGGDRGSLLSILDPLSTQRLCRNTVMVREPHHGRYCQIVNLRTYPLALSFVEGRRLITPESLS